MEPWGSIRDDLRAGVMASAIANWAGKSLKEGADPVQPRDFFATLGPNQEKSANDDGAVLLEDPEAQSKLIMAALFKVG